MIGKIRRVPLRDVWKHEEADLTPWLQDNLDVINEVLGLSLASAHREKSAGDFRVDLVAEDDEGGLVVVENQFGRSNHDHLGKLLTYLVAVGAKAAIWIVEDARPEHIAAVSRLNESGVADFFLVKLEGVQIGDSSPAPLLTLVVGPSEEGREVGETKKELSARHVARHRFWTQLFARAEERAGLRTQEKAKYDSWQRVTPRNGGLAYGYMIHMHGGEAVFSIMRASEEESMGVFSPLLAARAEIEKEVGGPLEWVHKSGARECSVSCAVALGGWKDEPQWPGVQDAMIDAMLKLERAIRPRIASILR